MPRSDTDEFSDYDFSEFTEADLTQIDEHISSQHCYRTPTRQGILSVASCARSSAHSTQGDFSDTSESESDSETEVKLEPLEEFFSSQPSFKYNPCESASQQFQRLCREEGWRKGNSKQAVAWGGYLTALVGQFQTSYGTDEDDLDAWHELLKHVGIAKPPDNTEGCKDVSSK